MRRNQAGMSPEWKEPGGDAARMGRKQEGMID